MSETPENIDQALWETAKRRVGFRSHLLTYIIINAFLWALWYFSHDSENLNDPFPWPMWTTLGWGVGIAFHFARTYLNNETNSVEQEYQKLKNKQTL